MTTIPIKDNKESEIRGKALFFLIMMVVTVRWIPAKDFL